MMVELDVLPAPVMPTGINYSCFLFCQLYLIEGCIDCLLEPRYNYESTTPISTNYECDGLGGCILAVCDGASVEGSEECDGGAGCTSCACDANWRSTTPVSLLEPR